MPNRNWVGPNNSSNNPGSGNWNVAAFWGGTVPGTGDSVTLGGNGSAAAYTVTLDTNPTVQSVTINSGKGLATLAVGARTLTVTNNGGSVVNMNSQAALTLAGGTVDLTATEGGIQTAVGSIISGEGTITAGSTTNGGISGGGAIRASGGVLDLQSRLSGTTTLTVSGANDTLKLERASAATSVSFNGSTGKLEVGTAGTLTLTGPTSALSVGAGTVALDGASTQLTDANGVTLAGGTISGTGSVAANTNISGSGTVAIPISTAGTITASGSTLDLTGTVSGRSLVIGTTTGSDLKIDGTATSAAITINNSNQTLEIGAGGDLTINTAQGPAQTVGNGKIQLDGGTLGGTGNLAIGANGLLIGSGTVSKNITRVAGGTGTTPTITASGGTLHLTGTVTSGPALTIANVANSVLSIESTATAAAPIAISFSTQTLVIGASGNLTITNGAESITNGTIAMSGGTLTDSTGLSIGSGGTLTGSGVVVGAISGGGTIKATGGLLNIGGNLTGSMVLQADTGASSVLELGGTLSTSTSFTYLNTGDIFSGTLRLDAGALGTFQTFGTISGMHVATGTGVTATDVLDLRSVSFANVNSTDILNGNTIQVWGNEAHTNLLASFHLAAPVAAGIQAHFVSDGSTGTNFFLDDDPCYVAGTRILTAIGERMVESLMPGDIVLTLTGDELSAQPVKWIGHRRIDLTAHPRPETAAPIRIRRGAFADNMPHSDLLVSPDHAIFVDGKLICARQLINGSTIRQEKDRMSVEYFHVELDSHAILLAEGLPAESYLNTGNHGFFINSGEPLVLHPDMTDETDYPTREAGSCAPFVSDEASVRPVWQRLVERAAALGQPALKLDTTCDPELRIVAKGRTLRPLYGENGLYIFALPKGATEVRVISRAGAPTDARPWLDDRRCLGVNVERIVLRGASELREVPVDHPGLSQGWHVVERNGVALRRWTNGDAVVPLPVLGGPTMLEIRAGNGGMAYLTDADEQDQRAA